jgi:(E)-4-hydroxy-3-methylbut-2-enyl-diphosphate synthase
MIHACRFLVKMMDEEGMTYPLHLGVTEAGDADEGRIKSAVGIGTLLAEGVGDTIRVSLTEKPENEIQVAKKIIDHFVGRDEHAKIPPVEKYDHDPYHYQRFRTLAVQNIGEEQVPVVIANLCDADAPPSELMQQIGWHKHNDQWRFSSIAADYVYFNPVRSEIEMPDEKAAIVDLKYWNLLEDKNVNCYPMLSASEFLSLKGLSPVMNFIRIEPYELTRPLREKLQKTPTAILVCTSNNLHFPGEIRRMFMQLKKHKVSNPVIIESNYITGDKEEFQVVSSSDTGPLFIDGLGDGLMINNPSQQPEVVNQVSFGILQASRIRTTRTEFIACPGCGRTMFSLENTLQKVKEKTAHLKGLKIAVMGCIVNGPGEMADADYGYVGAGKGKVSLYKNKEVMQRNVPEDEAVDRLIHLIKTSGDWKEE